MTNVVYVGKGESEYNRRLMDRNKLENHMLWEGVGYMVHLKSVKVSVFCVLEIRVWVRALESKLSQGEIT